MSFLFKAVLGERVVHPAPEGGQAQVVEVVNAKETGATPAPEGRGSHSTSRTKGRDDIASRTSKENDAPVTASSLGDGRVIVSRDFDSLAREAHSTKPAAALLSEASNGDGAEGGLCKRKRNASHTDTRTLLLRVQTCPVAQDLRDALRELEECCGDFPYVTSAREIIHLVELLRTHSDDGIVISSVMRILMNLTDITSYPQYSDGTDDSDDGADSDARKSEGASMQSKRRKEGVYAVTEREKRQIRNSFLHELVPEVPLFLDVLKQAASADDSAWTLLASPFWVRFNCVGLLLRLEEHKPSEVHRLLLECHGVGPLVDLLSDKEKDGLLRNEALSLISSMTATDADVQTLVAFESGFEALLALAEEEGGVDGGKVVSECLSTAHNMLRGNAGTQKLFIQMGCARHLGPLLDAVPRRLIRRRDATRTGGQTATPFPTPSSMQSIITLSTVGIIACLIRDADTSDASDVATRPSSTSGNSLGSSVRQGFVQCGLLRPLTSLALCGVAVDDATRIEALRTLASLMDACKPAVLEFLQPCDQGKGGAGASLQPTRGAVPAAASLPLSGGSPVTALVSLDAPQQIVSWSPFRGVLEVLLGSNDKTMLGASAALVSVLVKAAHQSPDCAVALAEEVLCGFAPVCGVSGFAANNHLTVTLSGAALALALTGPTAYASGKFYAARLFAAVLPLAGLAERFLQISWSSGDVPGSPSESVKGFQGNHASASSRSPLSAPAAAALPTLPTVTLSPAMPANFLNAFASYLVFCLSGAHSSQRMDTAGIGASVFALLSWMKEASPKAAQQCLNEPSWFQRLLHLAAGEGQVNVRLWCAALAAYLCCQAPREGADSLTAKGVNRHAMLEDFVNRLGGAVALDNLVFDVDASTPQWSQPLSDVFSVTAATKPVVYDTSFVSVLKSVLTEFKKICPSHGSPPQQPITTLGPNSEDISGGPLSAGPHGAGSNPFSSNAAMYLQGNSTTNHASGSDSETAEFTAVKGENESLRMQLASQQTAITSLEEENARLRAELDSVRHELAQQQSTEATAEPRQGGDEEGNTVNAVDFALLQETVTTYAREAEVLRENVQMLEDALSSKDEEHQQLVQTLNMMEAQLQQQQQHQQRVEAKATLPPSATEHAGRHQVSLAQKPPVCQTGTQTEAANAPFLFQESEGQHQPQQYEKDDLAEESERELRGQLQQVTIDRDDLLVLVAELNDECVSIKEASTVPTPAQRMPTPPLLQSAQHTHHVPRPMQSDLQMHASAKPQCAGLQQHQDSFSRTQPGEIDGQERELFPAEEVTVVSNDDVTAVPERSMTQFGHCPLLPQKNESPPTSNLASQCAVDERQHVQSSSPPLQLAPPPQKESLEEGNLPPSSYNIDLGVYARDPASAVSYDGTWSRDTAPVPLPVLETQQTPERKDPMATLLGPTLLSCAAPVNPQPALVPQQQQRADCAAVDAAIASPEDDAFFGAAGTASGERSLFSKMHQRSDQSWQQQQAHVATLLSHAPQSDSTPTAAAAGYMTAEATKTLNPFAQDLAPPPSAFSQTSRDPIVEETVRESDDLLATTNGVFANPFANHAQPPDGAHMADVSDGNDARSDDAFFGTGEKNSFKTAKFGANPFGSHREDEDGGILDLR